MQFQLEHEMGTIRLRFLVEDPDARPPISPISQSRSAQLIAVDTSV